MTRASIRLALPAVALPAFPLLLLLSVAACNQKAEPPAAEPAPQAPTATEAQVDPAVPTPPEQAAQAQPAPRASVPRSPGSPTAAAPSAPGRPTSPAAPPAVLAPPSTAPVEAPTARPSAPPPPPEPEPARMVTVPAETPLRLTLLDDLASDTSKVEDRVSARVASDVHVGGETIIPEGSRVAGVVTYAQPSAKVKGRAALTVRFRTVTIGSETYDITTEPVRREARGTKSEDARNIGIGAGAGAVIGGIIGGRKGAGIGAAVGGAGGTGVVLATKGEEVRLPSGTEISTRLGAPLVVEKRR
jgi:hypothetical protein